MPPKADVPSVTCPKCEKVLSAFSLGQHLRTIHREKKLPNLQCHVCKQLFVATSLLRHVKTHDRPAEEMVANGTLLSCPKCPGEFLPSGLHSHLRKVHGDQTAPKLPCPVCKKVLTSYYLSSHIKMHERPPVPAEKSPCPICEKPLNPTVIWRHIRLKHTQVKKCERCEYKTTDSLELRRHFRDTHRGEDTFSCELCSYRSASKSAVDRHVLSVHLGFREFACPHCEVKMSESGNLAEHIKARHGAERFVCNLCGFETNTKRGLRTHSERNHVDGKDVACTICEKKVLKASLKGHMRKVHGYLDLKCPHCGVTKGDRRSLQVHVQHEHRRYAGGGQSREKAACGECDFVAKGKGSLNQHVERVHQASTPCELCKKQVSPGYLRQHLKYTHGQVLPSKRRICPHCSISVSVAGWSGLQEHIKAAHPTPEAPPARKGWSGRVECSECNYVANNNTRLEDHVKAVHLNIREYACEQCDKTFKAKQHLRFHVMGIHRKEKPFKCDRCDYTSVQKCGLNKHKSAVHDKLITYECGMCDYRGYSKSSLKGHQKYVHVARTRSHVCERPGCDKAFFNARHLYIHVKATHDRAEDYECLLCPKAYAFSWYLKQPMRDSHAK